MFSCLILLTYETHVTADQTPLIFLKRLETAILLSNKHIDYKNDALNFVQLNINLAQQYHFIRILFLKIKISLMPNNMNNL